MAPAVGGEVLWIASRVSSRKARNMAANPQVAVMFEPRGEAYVQADAELVTDLPPKERIWSSGMFPFPLEGFFGTFDDPDFVLIRLIPTSAIVMRQGPDGVSRETWKHPTA